MITDRDTSAHNYWDNMICAAYDVNTWFDNFEMHKGYRPDLYRIEFNAQWMHDKWRRESAHTEAEAITTEVEASTIRVSANDIVCGAVFSVVCGVCIGTIVTLNCAAL